MNLPELEGKTILLKIPHTCHRTWQNQAGAYLDVSSILDRCKVEVPEGSRHTTKGEKSSTA